MTYFDYPILPLTDGVAYGETTQAQTVQGKNLCEDFSTWTATGNAYIDDDGVAHIPPGSNNTIYKIYKWDRTTATQYYSADVVAGGGSKYHFETYYYDMTMNPSYEHTGRYTQNGSVMALPQNGNRLGFIMPALDNNTFFVKIRFTGLLSYVTEEYMLGNFMAASTSGYTYEPFAPNSPSPSYPSPLVNNIPAGTYRYEENGNRYLVTLPEDFMSAGSAKTTWVSGTGAHTQRIGKHVFTGSGNIIGSYPSGCTSTFTTVYAYVPFIGSALGYSTSICSHFININGGWDNPTIEHYSDHPTVVNKYFSVRNESIGVLSTDDNATRVTKFKSFLAAQYAAGTPVTVYYQLATPIETTITPEFVWQEPVTDHTANSFVDIAFLNRIEQACEFLEGFLNGKGYSVNITTKTDWAMADFPYRAQVDRIRSNVEALQTAFYSLPDWREIVYNSTLDFNQCNALEWDLHAIDIWLQRMIAVMTRKAGTLKAGGAFYFAR